MTKRKEKKTETAARSYQSNPDVINYSKISTYLRCPLQYYFSYVKGIKVPPKAALTFGSAFHKALEHNYRQKISSRKDLKTSEVKDAFAAEFERRSKDTSFEPDESPSEMLDHGVLCVGVYHDPAIARDYDCEAISPKVQPIMVEETFCVEFENLEKPLMGSIDLVAEGDIIRDTKTSARKPSPDDAFKSFQVTCYAFGYQIKTKRPAKGIVLDYMVKTKKPQVISLSDQRSQEDIKAFLNMIGKVEFAIKYGLWYPNPHNFLCSPKACGFWNICEAGRKPI